MTRTLLIPGGAGFIGSNFARLMLERHQDLRVVVLDKLTYAGNLQNLADLPERFGDRYAFAQGDIADQEAVQAVFRQHSPDTVANFAAATHVDRSILGAEDFLRTDVHGTFVLLEAARTRGVDRYLQVSTDEVYGEVLEGASRETDPLAPRNPYSASKAAGDLMVLAYHHTYGLPVVITRGSNTFGPYQYPEKVLPLFVTNALDDLPLPLYGNGRQVREWTHVQDHCAAIDLVLDRGTPGEVYNVGSGERRENIEVTHRVVGLLEKPRSLIHRVTDRPGHDPRYALDSSKVRDLGWRPERSFEEALQETVQWYRDREDWWRPLKTSRDYLEYYQRQYGARLAGGAQVLDLGRDKKVAKQRPARIRTKEQLEAALARQRALWPPTQDPKQLAAEQGKGPIDWDTLPRDPDWSDEEHEEFLAWLYRSRREGRYT